MTAILPQGNPQLTDQGGRATRVFQDFLRQLASGASSVLTQIVNLQTNVTNLTTIVNDTASATITGADGITVYGTLAGGAVVIAGNPTQGQVPLQIADGTTYAIPANTQVLWAETIELLGTATIEVSGSLIEVN